MYNKNHKPPAVVITKQEITDEFKILSVFCKACNKKWKDFEGVNNATSPVISVQKQKNLPSDRSDNT